MVAYDKLAPAVVEAKRGDVRPIARKVSKDPHQFPRQRVPDLAKVGMDCHDRQRDRIEDSRKRGNDVRASLPLVYALLKEVKLLGRRHQPPGQGDDLVPVKSCANGEQLVEVLL